MECSVARSQRTHFVKTKFKIWRYLTQIVILGQNAIRFVKYFDIIAINGLLL